MSGFFARDFIIFSSSGEISSLSVRLELLVPLPPINSTLSPSIRSL